MHRFFVGKIDGKEIKDGSVILINVPSNKLFETNLNILKWGIYEKNWGVVYVTVNNPFQELVNKFKEEKINLSKIFIIDAVTPRKLTNGTRAENCVFIGSPKELTNISITTTSAIEKLEGAKVLVFDSVSTLLIYNDFEIVKEFIQFIARKMKELKVTFAIICIKDRTDEKIVSKLSAFVDDVIEVT